MNLIKSGLMTAVAFASFAQVQAADLSVSVEIPELDVAEYHKPYVAIWIEDDRNQVVSNLAVWYDVDMRNAEGEKWLKDMRQWWRRSGRSLEMPVDGVEGDSPAQDNTLRGEGKHRHGDQASLQISAITTSRASRRRGTSI